MKPRVERGTRAAHPPARPRRVRAAILSLSIGGVAALGSYAALGHLEVGPDEQVVQAANSSLAARAAQLDAMEADLQAAIAKNLPKLPPIPKYPPVTVPRIPAPQIITVSYVEGVRYKQGKEKYKKGKEYTKKQREAERKQREKQREAAKKRREEQHEAEKKRREEQKKREEH